MSKKILYLYVKGGAPLEHVFPRIAGEGELHVLALMPLPEAGESEWRPACTSVTELATEARGEALVDLVVEHARALGADAVLSISEFAVLLVAKVAQRLGLPGGGPGLITARDKRLMRETWERAGVPIPRFRRVDSEADLAAAMTELTPPLLLKPAWGAGSVAQLVLHTAEDVAPAWRQVAQALELGHQVGMNELYAPDTDRDLLVEEILAGSTEGWYTEPGYGDYVSVEGIVANGVYHPLCITGKLPAIPPFTEVASTMPSTLPEPVQRHLEDISRRAVDALGLETCGTHTEIKLGPDGFGAVIETGARFAGLMVTKQIEEVFGFDPIAMLVRELLGEPVDYPEAMMIEGKRAAASLAVIPTDAHGAPWASTPRWNPSGADWDTLLSPGTTADQVKAFEMPEGDPVPVYDPSGGSRNWLGVFFVTAEDAETLRRDCNAVLNGLEAALPA
ncbi:ATP-grasp domain-containing protein [Crossiella cryophila]|uniref:Biotin carboxylase n=1 Tax=Crossiella cryophila TaxID=43355 RepID=A0A7W7CEQ9_9PSEU|nr:ATP-grasp domain-containing protein [Crossiella cryophila]MBB4679813.1 biotin carboxylase [Crossiella cryophila]